jgi:hypothetical protein
MIRHAAMNFEAVKVSMSQDKNGITLRLSVHPNDCPKELHTDWVGTRYMVAMVRLQDDDTPDDRGYVAIQKMIASAGMLCRNPEFQRYLHENQHSFAQTEEEAVTALKVICGIESRSDFKTNESARKQFEALKQSFDKWLRGKSP